MDKKGTSLLIGQGQPSTCAFIAKCSSNYFIDKVSAVNDSSPCQSSDLHSGQLLALSSSPAGPMTGEYYFMLHTRWDMTCLCQYASTCTRPYLLHRSQLLCLVEPPPPRALVGGLDHWRLVGWLVSNAEPVTEAVAVEI